MIAPQPGLVPSDRKAGRWMFQCCCPGCSSKFCELGTPCGRTQHYARSDQQGGVTVEEAQHFGWRGGEDGWICPFCSGNTENLERIWRHAAVKPPETKP